MQRLRERYLDVPLDTVVHPASPTAQTAGIEDQVAAGQQPPVTDTELRAQELFEQAYHSTDRTEQIRLFDAAIALKPHFAWAFANRGWVRKEQGDLLGAFVDYVEAGRLGVMDVTEGARRGLVDFWMRLWPSS